MLRSLFCKHDWEFVKELRLFQVEGDKIPHGVRRVYVCNKCLKTKKIKL